MTEENSVPASENRRLEVFAASDDLIVRTLHIPETKYEGITVNSSWPEKGLVEGDIVLCARDLVASEGNVVLIEQGGRERLGIAAMPGFLETPRGTRPLDADENIVAVGVALMRNLQR